MAKALDRCLLVIESSKPPSLYACELRACLSAHEAPASTTSKAYWGSKWRFKVFDVLYTHPKDPETGKIVDVERRFTNLQQRLQAATSGSDPCVNKLFEGDDDVMREVKDKTIVQEYCKIWLKVLNERAGEVEEARAVSVGVPRSGQAHTHVFAIVPKAIYHTEVGLTEQAFAPTLMHIDCCVRHCGLCILWDRLAAPHLLPASSANPW